MASDDRGDDDAPEGKRPRTDDPDRAAILARRQRFIAIALSGLTTAACDPPASSTPDACLKVKVEEPKEPSSAGDPQPCLNVDVDPSTSSGGGGGGGSSGGVGGDEGDAPDTAAPTPCLEVMPEPPPRPCLSPRPCLKVAPPPSPCLDVAPPTACLKVAAPKEDPPPKPPPKPCLKVKAPSE